MKLYIITDLEGVAGVKNWHYAEGKYLERGNQLLIGEVNAALEGARACGAAHFTVLEGHQTSCLKSLHSKDTDVISLREASFPSRLDASYDAVFFIGQHARAGASDGHLSHTMNGSTRSFHVNGRLVGEFGVWALVAGSFGVPVIFLSGDDAACREASELIPGIETAAVKRGKDIHEAVHLSPAKARARIRAGITLALAKLAKGSIPPLNVEAGCTLDITFYPERIVRETYEVEDLQPEGIERLNRSTVRIRANHLSEALLRRRDIKLWKTVAPAKVV
ncbi:MAG TPA: M55 family metallopeptidase [Chthoniobacteraceae bacterium]|nr:M55 family metallopeptidase [Chthoniobacteraceae bacterium]